jgi:Transposase DDE domain group 1
VRLQLHALAYNLGTFFRTLATPEPIKDWSMTRLKEKLIKIGAKVVSHGRYVIFQMAEVFAGNPEEIWTASLLKSGPVRCSCFGSSAMATILHTQGQ